MADRTDKDWDDLHESNLRWFNEAKKAWDVVNTLMAAALDYSERCLRTLHQNPQDYECDLRKDPIRGERAFCAVCRTFAWQRVLEDHDCGEVLAARTAEREQLRTERDGLWQQLHRAEAEVKRLRGLIGGELGMEP